MPKATHWPVYWTLHKKNIRLWALEDELLRKASTYAQISKQDSSHLILNSAELARARASSALLRSCFFQLPLLPGITAVHSIFLEFDRQTSKFEQQPR